MPRRTRERNVDLKKAIQISVAANGLQIVLVLVIAVWLTFFSDVLTGHRVIKALLVVAFLVVAVGAASDIREAMSTRRLLEQLDDMDAALQDLEELNITLRTQRHDFLNHLQVVYSLMEMQEYEEAGNYIEKIYGEITAVSRTMKTAQPAVNALLQVKVSALEKAGVKVTLDIRSAWRDLPMPGWEMCKVLSNIIDNGLDAMQHTRNPRMLISLTESDTAYSFRLENNGPPISKRHRERIFEPGVSSKGSGRGMGLYIVRQTLRNHGGDIDVESTEAMTAFSGFVPRKPQAEAESA